MSQMAGFSVVGLGERSKLQTNVNAEHSEKRSEVKLWLACNMSVSSYGSHAFVWKKAQSISGPNLDVPKSIGMFHGLSTLHLLQNMGLELVPAGTRYERQPPSPGLPNTALQKSSSPSGS